MPSPTPQPIGYRFLAERHRVKSLPHFVESFVHLSAHPTVEQPAIRREYRRMRDWPGDGELDHLEFALKHEGLDLPLLRAILPGLPARPVIEFVATRPTSAYARRVWFLYEELSGRRLELPDVTTGNHAPLLDPDDFFTGPIRRVPRQRIALNLLGDLNFA
jgi:hypothetical protein